MLILENRKARFDYTLEETIRAGIVLEGWEVKSIRAHKLSMQAGYVIIRNGELWLMGLTVTPLDTACTHTSHEKDRTRKLLMKRREIDRLDGLVSRKGYTLIPTALVWDKGHVKVDVAVAKGKTHGDKRQTNRDNDIKRDIARMLRNK